MSLLTPGAIVRPILTSCLLLFLSTAAPQASFTASAQSPSSPQATPMKKITPIITVDAVEPCLLFWTTLGFEVTAEVPHGDAVGFAMLARDDLLLMYQSRASIEADLEASGAPKGFADELAGSTTLLFVQVESIDDVLDRMEGDEEIVVPRRETSYGMDEIFVRAPCGTVVGFAAQVDEDESD